MPSDKLDAYQRKRDFTRTAEPAGAAPTGDAGERRFVVQRHRASRLHYDLRFEIDGVLVSWAVPKGPTLDADVRRAAFHVEDHPIEYIDFEGVIPSGEYGGGDVIVWDTGTWVPYKTGDPARELADGELHAEIHGEKLHGQFVLVRTRGDKEWLLLHKHDDAAVKGWDAEDNLRSVLSGRTNDEVKADPDRLWRSDLPADEASRATKVTAEELAALDEIEKDGTWAVAGRRVRLTGLDRELAPKIRKRDLVVYTARIAPVVLPHLAARPLVFRRYGGTGKPSWQEALPARAPDWLTPWTDADGTDRLIVDQPAALIWAANQGGLRWYAPTWTTDHPEKPTLAVVEVPDRRTARLYRAAFDHLTLETTPVLVDDGAVQIRIPLAPGPSPEGIAAWLDDLAAMVGAADPNAQPGHTVDPDAVLLPYSPLGQANEIATPVEWADLEGGRPRRRTIRTGPDHPDPTAGGRPRQRLPAIKP